MNYGDATRNAINKIYHTLHRITHQPRLQILPLLPLLPQTQSENIQLQNILRIPVPYLRVEPLRVKNNQSTPTSPPREQPFTHPRLDPHPNPWIKKITKYLMAPQISKARRTQAAPRKVQHRLRRSPLNFRKKFPTQA